MTDCMYEEEPKIIGRINRKKSNPAENKKIEQEVLNYEPNTGVYRCVATTSGSPVFARLPS